MTDTLSPLDRLKTNIDTLLHVQGKRQDHLAMACGLTASGLNKALRDRTRGLPIKYLAPIAAFLGLAVADLFRDDLAYRYDPRLDRRIGSDRRAGPDRRVATATPDEIVTRDIHATAARIARLPVEDRAHLEYWLTAMETRTVPRGSPRNREPRADRPETTRRRSRQSPQGSANETTSPPSPTPERGAA